MTPETLPPFVGGFGVAVLILIVLALIALAFSYIKRPPAWLAMAILAIGFLGLTGFGAVQWQCHCEPTPPYVSASAEALKAYHRGIAERREAILVTWPLVIPFMLMSGAGTAFCFVMAIELYGRPKE